MGRGESFANENVWDFLEDENSFASDDGNHLVGSSQHSYSEVDKQSSKANDVDPTPTPNPGPTWNTVLKSQQESGTCKVTVGDPQVRAGHLGKYTSYLIAGVTAEDRKFSTRKRYSDFVWLRTMLVTLLPGVLIPALPAKQAVGRFDQAFIQNRMTGLENFLMRLLSRRVTSTHRFLLLWLDREETEMEGFKKEEAFRTVPDQYADYVAAVKVADGLQDGANSLSLARDADRLRAELVQTAESLRLLCKSLTRLATLSNEKAEIFRAVVQQLGDPAVSPDNSRNGTEFNQARTDLCEVFRSQSEIVPDGASSLQILFRATAAKAADAEALVEAIDAVDRLSEKNQRRQKFTFRADAGLRAASPGSGQQSILSSFLWTDGTAAELRIRNEQMETESSCLQQWMGKARCQVLEVEYPLFRYESNTKFNLAINEFGQRQFASVLQEAETWKEYFRTRASGSND